MKKFYKTSLLLMLFIFVASIAGVMAQPSRGGVPPSFQTSLADENQPFLVSPPDVGALLAEDELNASFVPRVAVVLPVDLNPTNSGEWITLETGETIWRLAIESEGANAITLYYSNFNLPKGSKLFIYNRNKTHVLGAYTDENNPLYGPEFATEFVAGDHIILEYVAPIVFGKIDKLDIKTGEVISGKAPQIPMPTIQIEGLGYAYNDFISVTEVFTNRGPTHLGNSGACQININCPQGAQWQNQKKGVAATIQRIGNSSYICSGSLINNLREDLTPYFLMAWHCSEASGTQSSAANFNQYQFYFHWERAGCENTTTPITYRTMTGCQKQADIPLGGGSDGLLLRLNQVVPIDWDVYYNGWDATLPNTWPAGSVGIHHPAGDVKKVSTASGTTTTVTANVTGYPQGAQNGHWSCVFNPSATEGGSSGSPLFNNTGLLIGTLSAGSSSCSSPNGSNIYGKMGYHFDKFNTTPVMKPFLDPDNTGARVCPGRYASNEPIANFTVVTQTPFAMQPVQFYSQCFNATSYYWEFPSGTPPTSTETNPLITYAVPGGPHDVTLTINGGEATKTEIGYITVVEKLNETEIEIGTATTGANFPLGYPNNFARVHQATLYTTAQLGSAGEFRSISWYAGTARSTARTIRIWMEHTNATNVSGVDAWNIGVTPTPTATLVAEYTGQSNIVGWNRWNFNVSPFNYNGTQNVIIYVEVFANSNSSILNSMTNTVRYTASGTNTNRTWHSNATTQPTANLATNNQVPNIRMLKAIASEMPVANFTGPVKVTPVMAETFDIEAHFLPAGWTKIDVSGSNHWKWVSGGNDGSPGCAARTYTATGTQNSWLVTPAIPITSTGYKLEFNSSVGYLSYYPTGGSRIHISTTNTQTGSFTLLKQFAATELTENWSKYSFSLDDYVGETIYVGFQYTGTDGHDWLIDDVVVGIMDPLGKYEIYKDQWLELTDLSTGPPVVWNWQYPGSTTPVVQTFGDVPFAQYEYAGTYDLGLTVTNLHGSNTKYMSEQLIVKDRTPRADFKATAIGGYDVMHWEGSTVYMDEFHKYVAPGMSVEYLNTSTNLPDSYEWNFSGGTPANSTTKDMIVKYDIEGDFTASLTAKNTAGENTNTQEDLVYCGYTEESLSNFNIEGFGLYTGQVSTSPIIWLLGPNPSYWAQAGERYDKPENPGFITEIMFYLYSKGTSTTKQYTMSLRRSDANGFPDMTAAGNLWSTTFTPASLPAAPGLVSVSINPPIVVTDAFYIIIDGFAANNTANNIAIVVGMGDEIPEDQSATLWLNYGGWIPANELFVDNPSVSGALWPFFTYTKLNVNPTQLTLESAAGSKLVSVDANVTYTTNTTDTWYTLIVGTEGITVNYQANTTGSPREGAFTVTGGGITKTVTVLQATGILTLNISPEEMVIQYPAETVTFNVTSNVLWTATCPELWVTIANPIGANNGTFMVQTTTNLDVDERIATITISGGGLTKTVILKQLGAGPYLEIEPEGTINVPKLDGSRNIQVNSNIYWFATANQPWISFTQQTGNGNGYVYFNFNANPTAAARTAVITLYAGDLTATLTVVQEAGDGTFVINPNTLLLPFTSGSQTVAVTTPTAWTADVPADVWYTVSPQSGNAGTQTVTIIYTANNNPVNRTSEVPFENGSIYRYLQITQKGSAIVSWNVPVNGTLQVLNGITPITNGASIELGTQLTVVATPNTGFMLSTLTLNSAPLANNGAFLVDGTSTINVQFEIGVYTLFFDPAGGIVSPTSMQITYGTQIGTLPTPTRTGYTFNGWFIGTTQIFATTTWTYPTHQTATAQWSPNNYTLTLNPAGGTVSPTSTQVTYGLPIGTLPTPTRTGYTFCGWFIGTTQIFATTTWNYASNQTATACWNANTYTLTFNPGLGTVNPTSITVTYNQPISTTSLPIPTRPGYTYTGWSIGGTPITATTVWTWASNQTATTTWTANTYTLFLDPSTGTVSTPSIQVTYNSAIGSIPNASQPNCPFIGWFIGNTQIASTTTWNYTSDQTAVARFNYPIVASASGPGTISPSGTTNYTLGQSATYTCTPNNGAHIVNVLVDGVTPSDFVYNSELSLSYSYTFSNIGAYHTISVTFAQNCYGMNPNNTLGFGASINMIPANCVQHGQSVTFNFSANCADITQVIIGGVSQGPISTYTMTATAPLPKIEIQTVQKQYIITGTPLGGADPMGYITPAGSTTINCGENITYEFYPEPQHRVSLLLIDGVSVPIPLSKTYTFTNVQENHTIHIEFEEYPQFLIQFGPGEDQQAGGYVYPTLFPAANYFVFVDSGTVSFPFTIVPFSGYEIDKVYVDDLNIPAAVLTGSYVFTNIKNHHTIYATFKPIMYTILATAGVNGSINPSGAVQVEHGNNQLFQIVPDVGCYVNTVFVDGVPVGAINNYTFENVTGTHTIHATFAKNLYQITTIAGANGTVSPQNPLVEHGSDQTITFYPATGYKVNQVTIDGIDNPSAALAGSYTFLNVTAPHTISVTFTKLIFTITATHTTGGEIAPSGIDYIEYDMHSEIYVFNPWDGYYVQAAIIDGVNNAQAIADGLYRFMNVQANHTIHIVFAPDNFTIVATAGVGGTINPEGAVTVPSGGSKLFHFSPETGFELARVIIDGINDPDAVENGSYLFTDVLENHTIAAQFEKKTYNVIYQPVHGALVAPVGGSVSPVQHGGNFKFVIDLEDGYSKSNIVVRANNIVLTLIGGVYVINNIVVDQVITISGVEINKYEISAQALIGGSITPAGVFVVNHGDIRTFTITPDAGYRISDVIVNGESIGDIESYTFSNITEDGSIKAYFSYGVGIDDPNENTILVFSHNNLVTIVNEHLIPIKIVDIMDMYGRVVWTGIATEAKTEILLNIASGIYGVRITTESNTITTTKVSIAK